MKGPMQKPGTTCNTQDPLFPGLSRKIILHPGGPISVLLKSTVPQIILYADRIWLILFARRRFRVPSDWYSSRPHKCIGNPSSTLLIPAKKRLFQVLIACFYTLLWCICARTSWKLAISFPINYRITFENSLFNLCICGHSLPGLLASLAVTCIFMRLLLLLVFYVPS